MSKCSRKKIDTCEIQKKDIRTQALFIILGLVLARDFFTPDQNWSQKRQSSDQYYIFEKLKIVFRMPRFFRSGIAKVFKVWTIISKNKCHFS